MKEGRTWRELKREFNVSFDTLVIASKVGRFKSRNNKDGIKLV